MKFLGFLVLLSYGLTWAQTAPNADTTLVKNLLSIDWQTSKSKCLSVGKAINEGLPALLIERKLDPAEFTVTATPRTEWYSPTQIPEMQPLIEKPDIPRERPHDFCRLKFKSQNPQWGFLKSTSPEYTGGSREEKCASQLADLKKNPDTLFILTSSGGFFKRYCQISWVSLGEMNP